LAASTAGGSGAAADSAAPAGGLQAAQQAMQRQQFAEAIQILSRVVAEQPDSAVAHFKLANCYAVSGKPDEALNHFTRAVELAPGNVDYRGARGVFHSGQKRHDAAISDFTAALEIDPTDFRLFNQRGLAHAAKRDYDKALADFDQVLAMNPRFAEGSNNRGLAKMRQGDGDGALKDFTTCLQLDPNSISGYSNRAALFAAVDQPAKAVADLNQAIARNRFNPLYYQRRQAALGRLGKTAEAHLDAQRIEWLKKLVAANQTIAKNPQDAAGYAERAAHFAAASETRAALADFGRAITLAP